MNEVTYWFCILIWRLSSPDQEGGSAFSIWIQLMNLLDARRAEGQGFETLELLE